jgi:hypothetical protein
MLKFGFTALCAALLTLTFAACEGPISTDCEGAACAQQHAKSDGGTTNPDPSGEWTCSGVKFIPTAGTATCVFFDGKNAAMIAYDHGRPVTEWSIEMLQAKADKNYWVWAEGACAIWCNLPPQVCADKTGARHLAVCDDGTCNKDGICYGTAPAATCTDGIKNGAESDVDCGDGCPKCAKGKACRYNTDCSSNYCAAGICADQPVVTPTCSDGVKNGNESDTDCGDGCGGCANGKACRYNTDCVSSYCAAGICTAPPTNICANVTCGSGLFCDQATGLCVPPSQVTCYGLVLTDPGPSAGSCTWFNKQGGPMSSFSTSDNVSVTGPLGACSVTCGALPQQCKGEWMNDHPYAWSSVGKTLASGGMGCAWDNKPL